MPVQTLKSFMRTVPPNPGAENDKPLPPAPKRSQTLSPLLPSPSVNLAESAWRAPTEWDNPSPPSQIPTTSIFTVHSYSPLIPEPSPGLSSMQTESNAWPFETSMPQHPRLDPIRERSKSRPSTPPRNPLRPSPLHTQTIESDPAESVLSSDYSSSLAVPPPET
jgi:hypothetical protein